MTSAEKFLTHKIENKESPSLQYFFFDQNHIIDSFQMGVRDIASRKKSDIHTTYNAFSVTKTFTALAILQLAQNKAIDINMPVVCYLPDFFTGLK